MRVLINIKKKYYYEIRDNEIIKTKSELSIINNKVIDFFKESDYILIVLDSTNCLFDEKKITHTKTLKTNGDWVWSADIEHYVEFHDLVLPKDFIESVTTNKKAELSIKQEQKIIQKIFKSQTEINLNDFYRM